MERRDGQTKRAERNRQQIHATCKAMHIFSIDQLKGNARLNVAKNGEIHLHAHQVHPGVVMEPWFNVVV